MAEELVEKVDFNNDGAFTGKDLDISWAYLQVKKRYEDELAAGGAMTITKDNFIEAVNTQYALNKTGTIAEATDTVATAIPGSLQAEPPPGEFAVKYERVWTFNDNFAGSGTTRPDEVFESVEGELTGTLSGESWVKNTKTDSKLMTLGSKAKVKLYDGGVLRNDKSWSLYIRGYAAYKFSTASGQTIFSKGGMSLKFYSKTSTKSAKIVFKSSYGDSTFLKFPLGRDNKSYPYKSEVEIYVVKSGIEINVYINGEKCRKNNYGSMPRLLSVSDSKEDPIYMKGVVWNSISKVFISDNKLLDEQILNVSGSYIGDPVVWGIRSDLNITNSFFAYRQYVKDRYNNFLKFDLSGEDAAMYGSGTKAQRRWLDLPAGGTNFGFDTTDRAKCLNLTIADTKKEYLDIPNVNFKSNFTLAFWIRTNRSASHFIKFEPDAGGDHLGFGISADRTKLGWQKPSNKTLNNFKGTSDLDAGHSITDTWYHITIVKNRNWVGTWINGNFSKTKGGYSFSDGDIADIGLCTLRFCGKDDGYLYLADLRFTHYAMSHIPHDDYGKRTSYEFIDSLKAREYS